MAKKKVKVSMNVPLEEFAAGIRRAAQKRRNHSMHTIRKVKYRRGRRDAARDLLEQEEPRPEDLTEDEDDAE